MGGGLHLRHRLFGSCEPVVARRAAALHHLLGEERHLMSTKIAEAFAARKADVRDAVAGVREQIQFVRESAPTLTTGLLIGAVLIGGFGGYIVSSWWTRWTVNAEWRERIAAKSATVRNVIDAGNAEISATDDEIINALGDTDARLSTAENALRSIKPMQSGNVGECRIPASGLLIK